MDKSTYEVRLAHWAQIVKAASERPAEQLLRDWLDANDISKDQYYYWQRRVRDAAYKTLKPDIPELPGLLTSAVQPVELAEIPLSPQKAVSNDFFVNQNASMNHADAVINKNGYSIAISNSISKSLLTTIFEVIAHA